MLIDLRDEYPVKGQQHLRRVVWRLRWQLLWSRRPQQKLLLGSVLKRLEKKRAGPSW